jgi:hypothetical protein
MSSWNCQLSTKGKGWAVDSDSDDCDDMSPDDVEPAVHPDGEIVKKGALIHNLSGNNQWGGCVGKYSDNHSFSISYLTNVVNLLWLAAPLTNELKDILRELNRNNIVGYDAILSHLAKKGYKMGYVCNATTSRSFHANKCLRRIKLAQYLKETGVRTSRRKLIHPEDQQQLVLDEISTDPQQTLGPWFIHESLALKGKHIPQYWFLLFLLPCSFTDTNAVL